MKPGEAFWVKGALVVLAAAAATWALRAFGLPLTDVTPDRIRTLIASHGGLAPVIYLGLYSQPLVPLPASIMGVTAGLAFGPLWGMAAALTGATTRACTQFGVARWVGHRPLLKLFKGRAVAFHQRIGRNAFHTVLLIRLIPNVPYDMQNYGLGFSSVAFGPYVLATALGVIPSSFAFAYLGDSLTDLRQLWKFLFAILLVAGLVITQRVRAHRRTSAA